MAMSRQHAKAGQPEQGKTLISELVKSHMGAWGCLQRFCSPVLSWPARPVYCVIAFLLSIKYEP